MTASTLKFQGYHLPTLYLDPLTPDELKKVLHNYLDTDNSARWVQLQPIILNIANAKSLNEINEAEMRKVANESGFFIVGITAGGNQTVYEELLARGYHPFPLTMSKRASSTDDTTVATTATPVVSEAKAEVATEDKTVTEISPTDIAVDPETTMIHVGNVRSGTQLYARNKSLVIIGNVGDGADVMADDCIYIFGAARGRVMAGGKSNNNSIIYCEHFYPQVISISGIYKTSDDIEENIIGKRVIARLKDDSFTFNVQN